MKKRHVVVSFAVAALLVVACGGKKVGGPCQGTESTCEGKKTALACRAGTYAAVACNGAGGCSKYKDHANCDTSVASAGDACMGEDDEYACSADKKRVLLCKGGKFEALLECRGQAGCAISGKAFTCDNSVAEKGDVCKALGANACSADEKQLLVCRDGKFGLHRYCRGAKGCTVSPDGPVCDETIAIAGDPCGVPGRIVCAADGKSELVCQGGVYTKSISCKNGCTVTNRPSQPIECN